MKRYFGMKNTADGRVDYHEGKPIWWAWDPDTRTSEWVFTDGSHAERSGLVLANFSSNAEIYEEVIPPGLVDYIMDEGL